MSQSAPNQNRNRPLVTVIGGGLAGVEAALQAAGAGAQVRLFEMRPVRGTPAHVSDRLAELVCSNSFGSFLPDRAGGLLKAEMRRLGSHVLAAAEAHALPAGGALAVDRDAFAAQLTRAVEEHPFIELRREEATAIPEGTAVIASGPLTSSAMAEAIAGLTGEEHLYFYDALAPIVLADSIDMTKAFRASRYGRGQEEDGDYINCPLDRPGYEAFVAALLEAEASTPRDFEADIFFEGCLPIEIIAARGPRALAFGPMRPVGLTDPNTGRRPYAVVQLRQDNVAGSLFNLVGFQTHLRWGEQERVLRLIPGLEAAEFVRLGQMHRNTFICSPRLLEPSLALHSRPDLFFAGQITGIEGYTGNAASGILAGLNAARAAFGRPALLLPPDTMLGALCHYITACEPKHFQPMKANFGLLPPLALPPKGKPERYRAYSERALASLEACLAADEMAAPQPAPKEA
ncbi:MAG: methylenetetrahydrofolate--tRNA-(uracil(54)-C(5))-methyltransferase (FADH(2)-oxidizing) TrmFO [Anaerolineae bacterium]